ncbi:MAG TPA: alpha/beta hydrolase [Candidatus Aquilonibacter sp.]|nr:alpha/beta hydrolase [Candidatus Aquilonibacter sp.]
MSELPKPSNQSRSLFRAIAVGIVIGFVVLSVAGFAFEKIAEWRDARRFPMRGTLVALASGQRLLLDCTAGANPIPTVLLDSGGFDSSRQWQAVQQRLSPFVHVCSFDRAGYGWSDSGPEPHTSAQIVRELYEALPKAGVSGPYLYVGHSFSGLDAITFAHAHQGEVIGVVLVDSVYPAETAQFPARFAVPRWQSDLLQLAADFGVARLAGWCGDKTGACPNCARFTRAAVAMIQALPENERQVMAIAQPGMLGATPLAVIAHDPTVGLEGPRDNSFEEAWIGWQQDLLKLSTNSTFQMVPGAGHEIQSEHPEIVVDAIRKILDETHYAPVR